MEQTPAVRGKRERRKELTRRQLLVAGRRLFGEKGLYESRVEDLTSVAGIAKGTLYGYFADKEALVHAVVAAGLDELLARVRETVARARGPEEVVAAMARAHIEFYAANPDLMRIFHQVRGMLKFRRPEGRILREALHRYLAELATMLAPGPGGRRTSPRAREEVVRLLFGSVSGITSVRAALNDDFATPSRVRATVSAVSAMIERSAGSAPPRPRRRPAHRRRDAAR